MLWTVLTVISSLVFAGVVGQSPVVNIQQGEVVGSEKDGIYEFHGIPYADTTSGINRFKAPLPPRTFKKRFFANRRNIKCVRALGVGYEGTEDCLVVNIFTPTLDDTNRLPVMVWIKGREFDKGYEPDLSFKNIVKKNVIVVTLNYRESILGFLCLGTETAPGNAGLKDIIAGLQWIKQNIPVFGGDPDNVTLFGHGSGAAAVDLITMTPLAHDLVHKVIAQSGTALAPWAVIRDNQKYAIHVAEALGYTITDLESLSNVFKMTTVAALMTVINELELTNNALAFAPCLEREDLLNVEPLFTRSPYEIIRSGDMLQIPFMTGFVDNEGTIRSEEALVGDWLDEMDESFTAFLQTDLRFSDSTEETKIAQQIRSRYFGAGTGIDMTKVDDYVKYHGDTMIAVSAIREVQLRAETSTSPIYLYQFSYKGTLGETFEGPLPVETAAHSEELAYLFGDLTKSAELDHEVANILIDRWTNFAKYGEPRTELSQSTWRPFTFEFDYFLRILDDSEMNVNGAATTIIDVELQNPYPETMTFWENIYEKHFRDAASKFSLTVRDNDENDVEDNIVTDDSDQDNGEEENEEENYTDYNYLDDEDGSGSGSGSGDNITEEETDESEETDTDSASTATAATFVFLSLFAVLNHFHISQLIL